MFLLAYFKKQRWLLLGYLLSSATGLLVLYLTLSPSDRKNVLYMAFLVYFVLSIFVFWDYRREKHRFQAFERYVRYPFLLLEEDFGAFFDGIYGEGLKSIYRTYQEALAKEQAAREEKDDFLTRWVHDGKLPITSLRMRLSGEKKLPIAFRKDMEEEVFQLEEAMNRMLFYLKIDHIEKDYLPREQKLFPLVSRSLKGFSKWFSYKEIHLSLGEIKETVVCDEKWVGFLLRELLSNAIKYTPQKGEIVIGSYETETEIVFFIRNTGEGIPERDFARIFQKGYTGYTGHKEETSSGYGLYLSKKVATELGIRITVESVYHESATFRLHFPRRNDYFTVAK